MCFDKAQTTLTDNSVHTAATSNSFGKDNVCAWKVKTISDYYFNKKIVISIKAASYVSCFVSNGGSMLSASDYFPCTTDSHIEIDANKHVFIVAVGLSSASHMQFDYYMADKMDIMWLSIIYSGSLFVLLALVAVGMILLVVKWIRSLFTQNQIFWEKMAIEMC